ncbi:MAG: TIGR00266 family protein [Clostridia bacterium]|nr:TIGR00266 family protein [Clostridia bacterium]MBQ3477897.1 TIGR00266 family protein [Clostridia bacterium]MBQ6325456.1 TIGR00266 family protein [Clostridia bacterium]MBQ8963131.1 TIGR00266 family protein [Clostridia bacterium]
MKYQIKGEPMPVVICQLEDGESVICESGAMSWMSPNLEMETSGGGAGKVFGRMFSGEGMFQNRYTARKGAGMIAFASKFPGDIRAVEITRDSPVICQKGAFLASTEGVELSVAFQQKFSTGLFGGEGFIMQKLSGNGTAFIEIDGSTIEYNLEHGQQMLIDTGYLAMMDATVKMEIQKIKGLKNVMLGGEGLFNTLVTGPGRVVIQTMPISGFAAFIASLLPRKS